MVHRHTEKSLRNLVKSNQNPIVFTIFRLILNQKIFSLVPNQSKNGIYNLISVDPTRFSLFLHRILLPFLSCCHQFIMVHFILSLSKYKVVILIYIHLLVTNQSENGKYNRILVDLKIITGQYNEVGVWLSIVNVHCTLFQFKILKETERKLLSSKCITDDYRRINNFNLM